jgi:tripartite-type tricarboxylate transporter receptor subunit TctC
MAPRGTPRPVLDKVYATLEKALNDPATKEGLERQGAEPWMTTPAEMVKFIQEEYRRFGEAIKIANVQAQ